jgi:hypothetical protein
VTTLDMNYKSNYTLDAAIPFTAIFHLKDEKTLGGFNVSSADRIDFTIDCTDANTTYTTIIVSNIQSLPIACNYTSFRFSMYYVFPSSGVNYVRSFVLQPDELFQYNVYLVDLSTTPAVQSDFIADDLLSEYQDIQIWLKANIGNETIQIHAAPVDIENKVSTYLVQGHTYIIEVHSSNKPIFSAGEYQASLSGQRRIKLYTFDNMISGSYFGKDVIYYSGIFNATDSANTTYAYFYYNDTANLTDSVDLEIINTATNTIVFHNNIDVSLTGTLYSTANISDYMGTSLKQRIVMNRRDAENNYAVTNHTIVQMIWLNEVIPLPFTKYISQNFMTWFLLILFSVLAIYSTMSSSVTVSVVIAVLVSIFRVFGWFIIPLWFVGIIDILAFAMFIKTRGNKKNE